MLTLKGNNIYLRALEPEDLDFLFSVENDVDFWEISTTIAPFSRFILKQYLKNSNRDIYEVKQLRLVICTHENTPIGMIDLFDFDPKNKRTGVGILISDKNKHDKGYGREALKLLCDYCFSHLDLHQVYANIGSGNQKSIHVFEKAGFIFVGTKKEWNFINGKFRDELLYQLIRHVH